MEIEYDGRFGEAQLAAEKPLYINRLVREAVLDQHQSEVESVRGVP
jgi:hypothetical protein